MLLPLRAFLGFTFCFGRTTQELADPQFFDAADPAFDQAQLAAPPGAARSRPADLRR